LYLSREVKVFTLFDYDGGLAAGVRQVIEIDLQRCHALGFPCCHSRDADDRWLLLRVLCVQNSV
jgi:hypothetical protein